MRQHAVTAAGGEQQLQDACACEDMPQAQRVWAATVRRYLSARASQGCVLPIAHCGPRLRSEVKIYNARTLADEEIN